MQQCLSGIVLPSLTEKRLTSLALAGNQDLQSAISAKKGLRCLKVASGVKAHLK